MYIRRHHAEKKIITSHNMENHGRRRCYQSSPKFTMVTMAYLILFHTSMSQVELPCNPAHPAHPALTVPRFFKG